ncbi:U32 family peptidase [Hoylesella pleuritidis]|uniref:peptidase U32 family protein n=1 Tax=Hoylesella pleuritidis TaxID=407975 RepID=UPI0028E375B1|nr:U32 family peptidase [Hoylesella pleuritidis]
MTLELLAPAKNIECGLAAIDHGADAVYIGAQRFGARASAGNSIDDIRQLCTYAHRFAAKVYVTINTIIYEDELPKIKRLLLDLAAIDVDAVLVQDMGIVKLYFELTEKYPEIKLPALHASTQTDNRTPEKVAWLQSLGVERAVLARELSAEEIADIRRAVPDIELEVFVHGALCVCYSGVCYASQHCFGRSANRGECAQFCRMKFDLKDAAGQTIEYQRHLLSLKDMCQINNLETLAAAGASSFKIEGRLKDINYVKNVVAAYSQRLDRLVAAHPSRYRRASVGRVSYTFTPNLNKTFNRGFTPYFINGRHAAIASFDTPKAIGEYVGKVKEIRSNSFNVAGTATFANGDGLCFINHERELQGFRVNRVEGNRLFPLKMPTDLHPGTALYRNNDHAFETVLAHQTAVRKIPVKMILGHSANGFSLRIIPQVEGFDVKIGQSVLPFAADAAQKPQYDNIVRQLSKLGNTPYECAEVTIENEADRFFIPSSLLAELRRTAIEGIEISSRTAPKCLPIAPKNTTARYWQPEYRSHSYLFNSANTVSRAFYENHGLTAIDQAFEIPAVKAASNSTEPLIMQCRHCLKYSLGACTKHGGKHPAWREPLYLQLTDSRRFRLEFNCKECQMNIYAES